ncbi:hypothetical protein NOK12_33890 [Nocardioides sp. OK12]|uniref:site-specific DNA-methyltransferase n=1 Tax=Nocardioides sp. OK12 TaxID=2758661 RepID=UPI0021C41624|nr:site-specific DNA-methyltransferase [Nocardioides sp. OK12]GHJ60871.1 hypothetical protein NOK12_33890 [Nocardioides sp. OK12]
MENRGLRLELTWPNKDRFLLVPKDDEGKPVWVDPDHPAAAEVRLSDFTDAIGEVDTTNPYADNVLFTGDSLDVLRILAEVPEYAREYRGKVNLAYIDPPFNTGQTFTHYDDWMEHSTWLSFMRDRLLLIKELLAPDGSLWLHLDNFEIHRMRCLLDEVFGADNYLNTVVWKRTGAKAAARRGMGTMYDNILVYGRSEASRLNAVLIPYTDDYIKSKYNNEDERGRYQTVSLLAPGIRSGDSGQPWMGIDPGSRRRHWAAPKVEGFMTESWPSMTTRQRLDALLEAGYIHVSTKEDSVPRQKRYLSEAGGVSLGDFWNDINVLNSQGHERVGYDTQKPEALLQRVIEMSTKEGDIVLDCFGGSGTTASAAHKMSRRWVTCDILPATVEGYTRPRLEKVVAGDSSGITTDTGWTGGGGFRAVDVSPSMYEVTPFGVLLADWATNGRFARAVAGQLGFNWQSEGLFCGVRGRMRLAVFDGAIGAEEVRQTIAALGDKERVTIVAKAVLPGAEETLRELSTGSRIRKAPRDLLSAGAKRARRRVEAAERSVQVQIPEGSDQ